MENTAISISIIRILNVLKKRWFIVVALTLICGIGSYYYTANFVPKSYRATVQMYVYSKESSYTINGQTFTQTQAQTAGDLSLRSLLINDCLEAVKLPDVVENVNKDLKSAGISKQIFSGNISTSVKEETRFFFISLTTGDPELCNKGIRFLADESLKKIEKLLQVDNIQIVSYSDAGGPVSPNATASARNAAGVGFIIGMVVIILMAMADRTVKDEEEFSGLFGDIPVIGSIPEFNLSAERSAANKARKSAQRSNRQQQPGRPISSDDFNDFSNNIPKNGNTQ